MDNDGTEEVCIVGGKFGTHRKQILRRTERGYPKRDAELSVFFHSRMPPATHISMNRQHQVPRVEQQPKALLELLGRARGPLRGHVLLSTKDAAVVCNMIASFLVVEDKSAENDQQATETQEPAVDNADAGEGAELNGKDDPNESTAAKPFALEIDQEVSLDYKHYSRVQSSHSSFSVRSGRAKCLDECQSKLRPTQRQSLAADFIRKQPITMHSPLPRLRVCRALVYTVCCGVYFVYTTDSEFEASIPAIKRSLTNTHLVCFRLSPYFGLFSAVASIYLQLCRCRFYEICIDWGSWTAGTI